MPQEPEEQTPQSPPLAPPVRRPVGAGWTSLIEEKIRQAEARGEFDNLAGAGKPLVLDENPYAGDKALGYSLLKSHGLVPREIELGQEIDRDLARAEALLEELEHKREVLARKRLMLPFDRRAYEAARRRIARAYEALLREARSKSLSLSISAPVALHRPIVDVEARMRAFAERFPPVAD